ncbi:MAG: DUF2309 domain-containing protein [Actinomycetota bacterium]|jgi:uncharacterized protein
MTGTPAQRAVLATRIAAAARIVPPVWPLERFVAVNPLLGLIDQGFHRAVVEAQRWLGAAGYPGVAPGPVAPRTRAEEIDPHEASVVDRLVGRWCALLVDDHGPAATPGDAYLRWRGLAAHDPALRRRMGRRRLTAALNELPGRADDAVLAALDAIAPVSDPAAELRGQLARRPGWAGYARWCDEWATPGDPQPRLRLVELLAIGLATDGLILAGGPRHPSPSRMVPPGTPWPGTASAAAALAEAEAAYRARLLASLDRRVAHQSPDRLAAQVVCCIDARSEALRRHLEAVGPYETLGFAGFFAAPIRFRPSDADESYPSAPVLLQPDLEVGEVGGPSRRAAVAAAATLEALGHGPLSMFATAEAAGWILGPLAAARTLAPGRRPVRLAPSPGRVDAAGITLDEGATMVEAALRTMGLTAGFAPLVLLCGHGSTTTANPHGASLDCGACGGNRGGPNARSLAALANDPAVRAELARRDLSIGPEVWFAAAEHDTTTDVVTMLDAHLAPASHRPILARLATDLGVAGQRVAAERLARLPGTGRGDPTRQARARAGDWAETRPEWGLARNAAFIAAPRALTRGVDLEGRVFLHSYDPAGDPDGTALETILTAPMVVAHWINAQYYFSTVDPDVYGAGDKALHNPVAGIGVIAGDGHDLRIGLPWQSVAGPDGPYHEPLRLLSVVQAPLERIDAVVARNPVLQHLFDGEWVHLVAVPDPHDGRWWWRQPSDSWHELASGNGQPARPA